MTDSNTPSGEESGAVAWRLRWNNWPHDQWKYFVDRPVPAQPSNATIEPLYPASEIERLRTERDEWRKKAGQSHDEANRYVNEMVDWKARAEAAERATHNPDTAWFWRIVDAEGLSGLPSDEGVALSRLMACWRERDELKRRATAAETALASMKTQRDEAREALRKIAAWGEAFPETERGYAPMAVMTAREAYTLEMHNASAARSLTDKE